jgi:hypothetical protein
MDTALQKQQLLAEIEYHQAIIDNKSTKEIAKLKAKFELFNLIEKLS